MRLLALLLSIPIALIVTISLPPVQALFTPSPELLEQLVREARAKPPAPGPAHLNIVYRRTALRSYRLDLYGPTVPYRAGEAPIVVFLHGGSWIQGDKVTIRVVDRFLARMREAGYFVAALNYTTNLLRGFDGPLRNVSEGVLWLARNAERFGYDPHRIGLYGVSAGGHLALLVASAASMDREASPVTNGTVSPIGLRGADAFSFSFAFIECAPTDLVGMREGDAFDNSRVFRVFREARLRELSPLSYVHADLPPVLIFHGEQDRTVALRQSERYVEAVQAAGGDAQLVRYPEGDHAFLNLSDEIWHQQETRALEFFARQF